MCSAYTAAGGAADVGMSFIPVQRSRVTGNRYQELPVASRDADHRAPSLSSPASGTASSDRICSSGLAILPFDNFGHGDPMVLEPLVGGVKFLKCVHR